MDDKVFNYIKEKTTPALDTQDKFMFFFNCKAASTSVNRKLLKNRAILYKSHKKRYLKKKLDSYTKKDFEAIFKFTIVRNPWTRTVSAFRYLKRYKVINSNISFEWFVNNILSSYENNINKLILPGWQNRLEFHVALQYPNAYFDGQQYVDYVAKVETISKDWNYIASKIDCPFKLPHANKLPKVNYKDYYSKETKNIVERVYNQDIELFNYKF